MERPEQKNDIVNAPIWGDGSRVEKGERIAPADTNFALALLMMMSAIQKKSAKKAVVPAAGAAAPVRVKRHRPPHLTCKYHTMRGFQSNPRRRQESIDEGSVIRGQSISLFPPNLWLFPPPSPNLAPHFLSRIGRERERDILVTRFLSLFSQGFFFGWEEEEREGQRPICPLL